MLCVQQTSLIMFQRNADIISSPKKTLQETLNKKPVLGESASTKMRERKIGKERSSQQEKHPEGTQTLPTHIKPLGLATRSALFHD